MKHITETQKRKWTNNRTLTNNIKQKQQTTNTKRKKNRTTTNTNEQLITISTTQHETKYRTLTNK